MRRILASLLLILVLGPGTWLRTPVPPRSRAADLRITAVPLPAAAALPPHLGAFRLEAIWQMKASHWRFGGYSALVPHGDGGLLAFNDRGFFLDFSPPGAPPRRARIGAIVKGEKGSKSAVDAEAATIDARTGTVWIGWEAQNAITRHTLAFRGYRKVRPPAMRDWGENSGPEAMTRLADGRFLVLREAFAGWFERKEIPALVFSGDPITAKRPPRAFRFVGPAGFRPTDMAQMPDGRVLILMRRLLWPAPARFAGRIVVADPAAIRPGGKWRGTVVAQLSSSLPVDNFEGLAIEPRPDGKLTVWLISDDNGMISQRALLWKLVVDPARLR